MTTQYQNNFKKGLRDGIPIALGYLSVSLTIGMAAVGQGLPVWSAVLISLTNLTSAGEVAGIAVIVSQGSYFEMALTELVVNLRYALMSLSWTQKLDRRVTLPERMLIACGNTDEIFAVSSAQPGTLGTKYILGLTVLPFISWTAGTAIGALLSNALPTFLTSAFSVAIYGMFLAIVIPAARGSRKILVVTAIAVMLSCCFYYIPVLKNVGSGFVIIICAVVSAGIGACLFPLQDDDASMQEVSAEIGEEGEI